MSSLLVFKQRNPKPRLRQGDLLKLVEIADIRAKVLLLKRIGERKEAGPRADLVRIGSCGELSTARHLFLRGFPQLIHIGARQIELADLLFQSHPLHQIAHACFNGLGRIQIDRLRLRILRVGRGPVQHGCREKNNAGYKVIRGHSLAFPHPTQSSFLGNCFGCECRTTVMPVNVLQDPSRPARIGAEAHSIQN